MNQDLTLYYRERAKEYDKVYRIPEEQNDLIKASEILKGIFSNKSILEIACGTGYWTEQISKTAKSILATDINNDVIKIAKTRDYNCKVIFKVVDMFDFCSNDFYEGVFGGFIWSHILIQELDIFLNNLKNQILKNSPIAFIDSKQLEGTNHDINSIKRIDQYGNTFQIRKISNGSSHEVLKNFPKKDFLIEKLSKIAKEIQYIELEYYWLVSCKLR